MGVLRIQHGFVGSSGTSQVVFMFLLIPCCLTVDFRAPPIFPNTPYLWTWNAPTDVCAEKFNVSLDLSLFSLVGSPRVNVTGQNITLFYSDRLGYYPYIEAKTGKLVNGGLPQSASLPGHLEKAKADISYYIPTDHVGLAVIDWEEWRPTWVRNWQAKDIYRQQSILLVQEENAQLNLTEATKTAKTMFEKAGKSFMLETLKLGKSLKPNHLWGFYLFPECYNHYKGSDYNGSCYDIEKRRNDGLDWLWNESTALYPAIHLNSKLKSSPLAALFVRNRVQEAIRVSKVPSAESPLPIFTYTRPVFSDKPSEYLSQDDFVNTIGENIALGVSGTIFWGTSDLSSSMQTCTALDNHMKTTLNPYIINVTLAAKMCSQVLCQEKGVCTRKHWNSSDYLHLNPKNFAIQTGENGKYTIHGQLTLEDLQQFPQKFYCTCYANTSCEERDNIKNIGAVNVCVTNDICIDGFLNSKPGDQPPGPSSSTPPATVSPCVHGKHPKGCSKGRCSGQTISNNAQEGRQSVYRKNTSSRLYIQNKIIKTTPSSTSSVLIKFPVYIVYVLISFLFLYLIIYLA
uniref:Hyaluronidase n=1 Tax=Equus asinus TaxID=9793 RepID=A0A9L0JUT4_EQUAS|nr:hyaluronidase PH-20 isoform X1 [Equus asinus]XP_044621578.1 hyaluronidase PH-20 isoform X1 [Equus asinus]XP_044621579.1 hyaluronidase PH-20 isoform X1 [Equus asinus]XP_044621580.1 hyaluronidase PH-20 isoform X1 [Equus asinus]